MSESGDVALARSLWEGIQDGRLDQLEAALAPDAEWLAVEEGEWDCHDRATILAVMRRNYEAGGMRGALEGLDAVGGALVAAFRPTGEPPPGRPLEDGLAYVVVRIREGKIVKIKGCADRASAVAYAQAEAD